MSNWNNERKCETCGKITRKRKHKKCPECGGNLTQSDIQIKSEIISDSACHHPNAFSYPTICMTCVE